MIANDSSARSPHQQSVSNNSLEERLVDKFDIWSRSKSLPIPDAFLASLQGQSTSKCPLESQAESPSVPQRSPLIKEEYEEVDIAPKTPERDVSQQPPYSHRSEPQERNYFAQWTSTLRNRKETIVDDAPVPRRSKRLRRGGVAGRIGQSSMIFRTPPRHGCVTAKLPLERSSENPFRNVPPSALRLVETKGKYTFRRDLRIRDYYIPPTRNLTSGPRSSAYQCRDRFDPHDAPSRAPKSLAYLASRVAARAQYDTLEKIPAAIDRRSATPHHTFASGSIVDRGRDSQSAASSPEIKVEDDDGFEQWLAQGLGSSSGVPVPSIETE